VNGCYVVQGGNETYANNVPESTGNVIEFFDLYRFSSGIKKFPGEIFNVA